MSLTRDIYPLRLGFRVAIYHKGTGRCRMGFDRMGFGYQAALRMPTRMYGMLRAAGLRVPDRNGHCARGGVPGDEAQSVRAEVRVPYAQPAAAADSARGALPLPEGRRWLHRSGKAYAVPRVSVLAGAGEESQGVEEDGEVLPGDRQRAAGADSDHARGGGRDARGASAAIPGLTPQAGGGLGEVSQDDGGAGADDGGESLHHGAVLVDPSVARGGHDHGIF